jgi:long-chain acyl-CoA synthetase
LLGKAGDFLGEQTISYDRIWREAQWLADHLRNELGVKPGDPVAVWLKNCPEFVSTMFGIFFAGATLVPINNFLKPDEVTFILHDSGAKF